MKIYCIVVYTSASKKYGFHASLNDGWHAVEPHLETIQNNIQVVLSMIKDRDGIHTLSTRDQLYYAYQAGDELVLLATDEALSPDRLRNLFINIAEAHNSEDLDKLIKNPEEAVKSRLVEIQQMLEETMQQLRDDIEKITSRGDDLTELMEKTEKLAIESFKFSKRATDLKNKKRCPGLFSFFNSVQNFFSSETYHYDYEPVVMSKA